MAYTEILERNGKKYYYRVQSKRNGKKVKREKIYLGVNLDKKDLTKKETEADIELGLLSTLLSKKEITELEKIKKEFEKEPSVSFDNRYEAFVSLFTHDSTSIEGSTLSLQEVSLLLFDNIVPAKTLREINETLNHKNAFDYLLKYRRDINKKFICDLHSIVVKDTLKKELENEIGKYRSVQVFLRGTDWLPPKANEVSSEMRSLLSWYSKKKKDLHPLILAAYFHVAFETIHPFVDGNGRVGRLLMNFTLHKNGYPMINIPVLSKRDYFNALEDARKSGDLRTFVKFLYDLIKNEKIRF